MTNLERIEELLALELAKRSFTADFNGAVAILSALRAMPLDLRLALADELAPKRSATDEEIARNMRDILTRQLARQSLCPSRPQQKDAAHD